MTDPSRPVIAIDGPAASGKGTLSRKIAQTLNFAHMDTGALYRAVGYGVLMAGGDPGDMIAAAASARQLAEDLRGPGGAALLADPALRSDDVGQAASLVAAMPPIREALLALQRDFAQNPPDPFAGAVLDGRDIGTVICPQASVKLFVTATVEIRAQRRLKELQSKGILATYEAVLKDMRERDARDADRTTAPMKPAADAILLDTSEIGPDTVLEQALAVIREKIAR
jgi:cytidylate kinase